MAIADAATFLVAAALLARIRTSGAVAPRDLSGEAVESGAASPSCGTTGSAGARVALGSRTVRVLGDVLGLDHLVRRGDLGSLSAPYVRSVLESGPRALRGDQRGPGRRRRHGRARASATYGARWSPRRMLGAGAVAFGVVDLAIALYPLAYVQRLAGGTAAWSSSGCPERS